MVRICGKGGFARLRATPEASRNAFAVPTRQIQPFIDSEFAFASWLRLCEIQQPTPKASRAFATHNVSHKCLRKHLWSYSLI